ncbi:hypothetical protein [Polycyclovorans algicola]|uniref:hypothetical protein n=1 Tax=Polycyclovorans algicola TaxID=616992 RepID=UPI000694DEA0|nr:hypothetical protein [Polycyclovorans algicola]
MERSWHQWLTLRECDQRLGAPKGTAFRAFKSSLDRWVEGQDFHRLDAHLHADDIQRLRRGNRLYDSTVHVVLLSQQTAEIMGFIER